MANAHVNGVMKLNTNVSTIRYFAVGVFFKTFAIFVGLANVLYWIHSYFEVREATYDDIVLAIRTIDPTYEGELHLADPAYKSYIMALNNFAYVYFALVALLSSLRIFAQSGFLTPVMHDGYLHIFKRIIDNIHYTLTSLHLFYRTMGGSVFTADTMRVGANKLTGFCTACHIYGHELTAHVKGYKVAINQCALQIASEQSVYTNIKSDAIFDDLATSERPITNFSFGDVRKFFTEGYKTYISNTQRNETFVQGIKLDGRVYPTAFAFVRDYDLTTFPTFSLCERTFYINVYANIPHSLIYDCTDVLDNDIQDIVTALSVKTCGNLDITTYFDIDIKNSFRLHSAISGGLVAPKTLVGAEITAINEDFISNKLLSGYTKNTKRNNERVYESNTTLSSDNFVLPESNYSNNSDANKPKDETNNYNTKINRRKQVTQDNNSETSYYSRRSRNSTWSNQSYEVRVPCMSQVSKTPSCHSASVAGSDENIPTTFYNKKLSASVLNLVPSWMSDNDKQRPSTTITAELKGKPSMNPVLSVEKVDAHGGLIGERPLITDAEPCLAPNGVVPKPDISSANTTLNSNTQTEKPVLKDVATQTEIILEDASIQTTCSIETQYDVLSFELGANDVDSGVNKSQPSLCSVIYNKVLYLFKICLALNILCFSIFILLALIVPYVNSKVVTEIVDPNASLTCLGRPVYDYDTIIDLQNLNEDTLIDSRCYQLYNPHKESNEKLYYLRQLEILSAKGENYDFRYLQAIDNNTKNSLTDFSGTVLCVGQDLDFAKAIFMKFGVYVSNSADADTTPQNNIVFTTDFVFPSDFSSITGNRHITLSQCTADQFIENLLNNLKYKNLYYNSNGKERSISAATIYTPNTDYVVLSTSCIDKQPCLRLDYTTQVDSEIKTIRNNNTFARFDLPALEDHLYKLMDIDFDELPTTEQFYNIPKFYYEITDIVDQDMICYKQNKNGKCLFNDEHFIIYRCENKNSALFECLEGHDECFPFMIQACGYDPRNVSFTDNVKYAAKEAIKQTTNAATSVFNTVTATHKAIKETKQQVKDTIKEATNSIIKETPLPVKLTMFNSGIYNDFSDILQHPDTIELLEECVSKPNCTAYALTFHATRYLFKNLTITSTYLNFTDKQSVINTLTQAVGYTYSINNNKIHIVNYYRPIFYEAQTITYYFSYNLKQLQLFWAAGESGTIFTANNIIRPVYSGYYFIDYVISNMYAFIAGVALFSILITLINYINTNIVNVIVGFYIIIYALSIGNYVNFYGYFVNIFMYFTVNALRVDPILFEVGNGAFSAIYAFVLLRAIYNLRQQQRYLTILINSFYLAFFFLRFCIIYPNLTLSIILAYVLLAYVVYRFRRNGPPFKQVYNNREARDMINYYMSIKNIPANVYMSTVASRAGHDLKMLQLNTGNPSKDFDNLNANFYHHVSCLANHLANNSTNEYYTPPPLTMFNSIYPEGTNNPVEVHTYVKSEAATIRTIPIDVHEIDKNAIKRIILCHYKRADNTYSSLYGYFTSYHGTCYLNIERHLFGNRLSMIDNFDINNIKFTTVDSTVLPPTLIKEGVIIDQGFVRIPYKHYSMFNQESRYKDPLNYSGPACMLKFNPITNRCLIETGVVDQGRHNFNTVPGDCGLPIYTIRFELLGFHVASQSCKFSSSSIWRTIYNNSRTTINYLTNLDGDVIPALRNFDISDIVLHENRPVIQPAVVSDVLTFLTKPGNSPGYDPRMESDFGITKPIYKSLGSNIDYNYLLRNLDRLNRCSYQEGMNLAGLLRSGFVGTDMTTQITPESTAVATVNYFKVDLFLQLFTLLSGLALVNYDSTYTLSFTTFTIVAIFVHCYYMYRIKTSFKRVFAILFLLNYLFLATYGQFDYCTPYENRVHHNLFNVSRYTKSDFSCFNYRGNFDVSYAKPSIYNDDVYNLDSHYIINNKIAYFTDKTFTCENLTTIITKTHCYYDELVLGFSYAFACRVPGATCRYKNINSTFVDSTSYFVWSVLLNVIVTTIIEWRMLISFIKFVKSMFSKSGITTESNIEVFNDSVSENFKSRVRHFVPMVAAMLSSDGFQDLLPVLHAFEELNNRISQPNYTHTSEDVGLLHDLLVKLFDRFRDIVSILDTFKQNKNLQQAIIHRCIDVNTTTFNAEHLPTIANALGEILSDTTYNTSVVAESTVEVPSILLRIFPALLADETNVSHEDLIAYLQAIIPKFDEDDVELRSLILQNYSELRFDLEHFDAKTNIKHDGDMSAKAMRAIENNIDAFFKRILSKAKKCYNLANQDLQQEESKQLKIQKAQIARERELQSLTELKQRKAAALARAIHSIHLYLANSNISNINRKDFIEAYMQKYENLTPRDSESIILENYEYGHIFQRDSFSYLPTPCGKVIFCNATETNLNHKHGLATCYKSLKAQYLQHLTNNGIDCASCVSRVLSKKHIFCNREYNEMSTTFHKLLVNYHSCDKCILCFDCKANDFRRQPSCTSTYHHFGEAGRHVSTLRNTHNNKTIQDPIITETFVAPISPGKQSVITVTEKDNVRIITHDGIKVFARAPKGYKNPDGGEFYIPGLRRASLLSSFLAEEQANDYDYFYSYHACNNKNMSFFYRLINDDSTPIVSESLNYLRQK